MEKAEVILGMLASIIEAFGSDDETTISSATADLLTVRSWVEGIGAEVQQLNDDVERLNTRNIELQKSNNMVLRQLNAQREKQEEIDEKDESDYSDLF